MPLTPEQKIEKLEELVSLLSEVYYAQDYKRIAELEQELEDDER